MFNKSPLAAAILMLSAGPVLADGVSEQTQQLAQ